MAQHVSQVKNAVDGTIGVGLVTFPFWMQALGWGLGVLVSLGGLVLVVYRIRIAQMDLKEKQRRAEDGAHDGP